MGNPFIGEIRMFGGSFAPAGWAFCQGQLVPISQNDTLFVLLGTTYGGDGQETFALPNMQGRLPVHQGTSSSGTTYTMGEMAGVEEVTLTVNQIPVHTHPLLGSNAGAGQKTPQGASPAQAVGQVYASRLTELTMNAQSIVPVGGSQPHSNMQPFLCVSFIISLFGLFPQPN